MGHNQSFESQCGAITHDSDIRKLNFVFRNNTTGIEQSIDIQQLIDGLPANPALLPLNYARYTEALQTETVWTKPFEIRNRNKASFSVQFHKGPDTPGEPENFPVITPEEPGAPVVVDHHNANYGFTTAALTATTTPADLLLPAEPVFPDSEFLTSIRVTVNESFAAPGLSSLIARIDSPVYGVLLGDIDLMAAPLSTYETPVGFSLLCDASQLSWIIEAVGANLDTMTAGEFQIELTFEGRNPPNLRVDPYVEFNTTGDFTKTINGWFTGMPNGATITRIVANVRLPYDGGEGQTFDLTPKYNGVPIMAAIDAASPGITDSGVLSVLVSNTALLQLTCDSSAALNLLENGVVTFEFYWSMPGDPIPFEWSPGDQMHIVAFVSLDGIEYTPISVARHDFSNTPFVDIVKFEPYNIPDDFDPWYDQPDLPVGMPPGIPWLGNVGVQNSIMLFLTEFDNACTWNYIRFLISWIPAVEDDEEISTNDDASIEIVANAREL